jgi:hypothetical protein
MNRLQHSETASAVFHLVTIAVMAVFSALSMLRGAGVMV